MWLLSHHNWITVQHLFKGSNGSFSKELMYVPDKVLLGRQRGIREDSSSSRAQPPQESESRTGRRNWLGKQCWLRTGCGTEPSDRGHLVGSWQCQLKLGLLKVSQTDHVKFYAFVPAVLSIWDTCPTLSQLFNYYLLFKICSMLPFHWIFRVTTSGLHVTYFLALLSISCTQDVCISVPQIPHLIMDFLFLSLEAYAIMGTKFAFNGLKVTSDSYSRLLLEGE